MPGTGAGEVEEVARAARGRARRRSTRGGTARRGSAASRCCEAHDGAVVELGGDLERVGQAGALDDQAVVAGGVERRGQAARRRRVPSWWMVPSLPWTISPARTTLPPKAWPIAWWPRQTPSSGVRVSAAAAISARQMPASFGVQGPGESRIAEGLQRHRRLDVDLVVAADDGLGAELAQIVEEVVGEAVVVVDQQQHRRAFRRLSGWRPPARALYMAPAVGPGQGEARRDKGRWDRADGATDGWTRVLAGASDRAPARGWRGAGAGRRLPAGAARAAPDRSGEPGGPGGARRAGGAGRAGTPASRPGCFPSRRERH